MIGKIYTSQVLFYDSKKKAQSIKSRPILIIGGPRNNDYTVLPISRVTLKQNLDTEFDVELNPTKLSKLNLKSIFYVRTHKCLTVHRANMGHMVSDLKTDYPELYLEILVKHEEWNKRIINEAI